jgi:hypothetical protein
MAKKQNCYNYQVKSLKGFEFPIDMLRYDNSIPKTEVDSSKIQGTMYTMYNANERYGKDTIIELLYLGQSTPTPLRWLSFGWEVINIKATVY